ncbi:bifunctional riboflavin kinase/FAD synthetase [Paraglaciecola hydrolytica]|uniref:Riboflavin biosynthesis protein n=1 Tax=Paraglaciecola hydrolytica TaxID=1799789 RepID=A0A135ZYX4_9ALTE|nr:bifunctional riboflavin kinase/FAD synthetase [Paraglaciecola hydrolytica]KXI28181.1 bifunctional riboflavin kinase/FMN adenylyltransferase [Paraglaciecola hydrolytica]
MELIRGLHNLREKHRACVLTIGKFDGVHLGHQAVLSQVVDKARQLGLPATVMVFEPQPEELFTPDNAPARLSVLRDKYSQLLGLGIDRLLCVKFDREFASLSAQHFVEDLLVDSLGVKYLVVGDDFRFGKGRVGDFAYLQQEGLKCDFEVVSTQSFRVEDCRISSTAVRAALADSNFKLVAQMLGRPFSIAGKVLHGDKKGRTIGFPTANLKMKRVKVPVNGVFAVQVTIKNQTYAGVANIGHRPTVNGQRTQLEVHLFDFNQNLYGQFISVALVHKIREEMKFDSFEQLHQQIQQDAKKAQQMLALS